VPALVENRRAAVPREFIDQGAAPWMPARAVTTRPMRAGSATPTASGARRRPDIDWVEPPKQVFDPKAGVYGRWFSDGVCNTCWNAVDRHVLAGRGEQAAIIYDSPLAGQKRAITYHRLQVETQVLAAILRNFGVAKGDRVILYMPMVPEAVIGMLACARIGAVHSVVFGGFAAKRARDTNRRCQAESDSLRELRARAGARREI